MRRTLRLIGTALVITSTALLSGCLTGTPVASLAYGPGFHSVPHENVTLVGVVVPETVVPGRADTWRLEVRNGAEAGRDFVYGGGPCAAPRVVHLDDAYGRRLALGPAEPRCEAMPHEERLPPGGTVSWTWRWDGRAYSTADERHEDLGPGTYVLVFRFAGLQQEGAGPTAFHVFTVA